MKRQQLAGNSIAPVVRLFQFVASYFHASRFTSSAVEKIYIRNVRNTMKAMKRAPTQPLAREFWFRMLVAGARTLANATILDEEHKWMLKDEILSGGLKWFKPAPRYVPVGFRTRSHSDGLIGGRSVATSCR